MYYTNAISLHFWSIGYLVSKFVSTGWDEYLAGTCKILMSIVRKCYILENLSDFGLYQARPLRPLSTFGSVLETKKYRISKLSNIVSYQMANKNTAICYVKKPERFYPIF